MSNRLAKVRAAVTSLGVVFVVAVCFFLVLALLVLGIGTIWGFIFGGMAPPDTGEPSQSFEFTDNDGSVTITYETGDPLVAEDIFVVVDDEPRGSWAEHDHEDEAIEPDDSITVDDVADGSAVRIEGVDDDEVVVLGEGTV